MRDIVQQLATWHAHGRRCAVATLVGISGSSPRQLGAAMAVAADGEVIGSISGGCVEGAVYETAMEVIETHEPSLQTYGISDDEAFAVGLTCGGILEILVCPVEAASDPILEAASNSVEEAEPVAVATIVSGPGTVGAQLAVWSERTAGSLGSDGLNAAVTDDARGLLAQGLTALRHYGSNGERRRDTVAVFVHSFAPPPRMLIFGAIDFAAAMARIGSYLGYSVTVCDARGVFATAQRFPAADEVVREWPHQFLARTDVDERTVIAVLTHDPKFDVPLLEVALRTRAAYIGAMGSRRTHRDRLERLRQQGVTDGELSRLRSPIGLDLGARTSEETALSIAAEIVALRWGGSGRPLSETWGDIHRMSTE